MPDQPVEDGRGALRAAAGGADWALQPLEAQVPSSRSPVPRVPARARSSRSSCVASFERLVQEGAFLEHVTHSWGPRHGTLRSEIDRIRGEGRVPLLDLETHGALVVRDEVPGSITVFVKAPSLDELERRLRERATESGGEIEERVAVARKQLGLEHEFDHVIVNDDLRRAVDELEDIVARELRAAGTMTRP
ncbi:MAG: hypothetical protein E6G42_05510 [Actinobacteria bacterium]|nr:MAG: hypothetical protein E6G42_05510 [Actinomycetota bacterium]